MGGSGHRTVAPVTAEASPSKRKARLMAYSALRGADTSSYQSVRVRPIPRVARFALGRKLRHEVPRAALGEWHPADTRPDPVVLIQRSHEGRIASLIPSRIGRMVSSPYGFLRGATVVMTNDLASLPSTGIMPVQRAFAWVMRSACSLTSGQGQPGPATRRARSPKSRRRVDPALARSSLHQETVVTTIAADACAGAGPDREG